MTDIVDELRAEQPTASDDILYRAADEIERLGAELSDALRVVQAARGLYGNRLAHRPENPSWRAPQSFWLTMGDAFARYDEENKDD